MPEKCLSEAELSTATYALLAKTTFLVKTKAVHTHTHLPSSSSFVACWDKDVHRQHSALRGPSPGGRVPIAPPRGDRWLIKREITPATVTPNQSEDVWLRQDTIMGGSSTPACLKQRYGFQCPAHAFDQTLCYFRMGLSNT